MQFVWSTTVVILAWNTYLILVFFLEILIQCKQRDWTELKSCKYLRTELCQFTTYVLGYWLKQDYVL